jgi:hypothetical protein
MILEQLGTTGKGQRLLGISREANHQRRQVLALNISHVLLEMV